MARGVLERNEGGKKGPVLNSRVCRSAEADRGPRKLHFRGKVGDSRDGATEIFGNFRVLEETRSENKKKATNEENRDEDQSIKEDITV